MRHPRGAPRTKNNSSTGRLALVGPPRSEKPLGRQAPSRMRPVLVLDITERKRLEAERARLRIREAAMQAKMVERERISREFHDRVAHSMGVVYQNLQLHKALAENAPERAPEKLAVAEETAKGTVDQKTEEGVAKALWTLLEENVPDGVVTELSFSGDESLVPRDVGAQVYLI